MSKDEPAFPQMHMSIREVGGRTQHYTIGGLTKREYAAIQIMAGLINAVPVKGSVWWGDLSQIAVTGADALLAELEKSDG